MAAKTINTRIQLKNDTELHWRQSVLTTDHRDGLKDSGTSFVPLLGELIIFSADDAHPFSRLKVGDGVHNVLALSFIDGTIDGDDVNSIIVTGADRYAFPSIGQTNKLYIDLGTNIIYRFDPNKNYVQLSKYITEKEQISIIDEWSPGTMTTATVNANSLVINNGIAPALKLGTLDVVTDISEVHK